MTIFAQEFYTESVRYIVLTVVQFAKIRKIPI